MRKRTNTDQIIDDIYRGILEPDAWDRAMQGIMEMVGAVGQLCVSLAPATGHVYRQQFNGHEPADVADYHEHWVTKDPRIRLSLEADSGAVVTEQDLLPFRTFSRSEVFNEFLKPNHMPWVMAIWLQKEGEQQTYFSLQGASDRKPFHPDECSRLLTIVEHIRRSLAIQDRLRAEQLTTTGVLQGLDHARFGGVLLDDAARIVELSDTAARMLARAGMLEVEVGTCRLPDPVRRRLRVLMHGDGRRRHLEAGEFHIELSHEGSSLTLILTPALELASTWFGRAGRWLAILFERELADSVSPELLCSQFRLSRTEARVAHLLCKGRVPKQIACQYGTSPETVRTQIKSIYRKLDVHTRAELMSRVLGGARYWV